MSLLLFFRFVCKLRSLLVFLIVSTFYFKCLFSNFYVFKSRCSSFSLFVSYFRCSTKLSVASNIAFLNCCHPFFTPLLPFYLFQFVTFNLFLYFCSSNHYCVHWLFLVLFSPLHFECLFTYFCWLRSSLPLIFLPYYALHLWTCAGLWSLAHGIAFFT